MFSVFLALLRKDLKVFFSDRRAVVITLLVPLALASFMGMITGGGGGGTIDIRIVDLDHSALSQKLIKEIESEKSFDAKSCSEEEARELVQKGKVSVAIVIPKGFGEAAPKAFFSGGEKPELKLLYDPSDNAELAMARGVLTQHIMQTTSQEAFAGEGGVKAVQDMLATIQKDAEIPGADKQSLQNLFQSILLFNQQQQKEPTTQGSAKGGLSLPYTAKEEAVTSGETANYNAYAHSFAGMAVQFLLFLSMETGSLLLAEKQRGLWRRFRAAPLSKGLLLASRAVSGALLALFVLVVLFVFGIFVFGIEINGSLLGFLLIGVSFALMSAAFGLLLSTVAKTPQAMRGSATFVVLILTMLGGAWFPAFMFPKWVQTATLFTPTRWAMDGFDAMTWRGLGLDAALAPAGVLFASMLLLGGLAVARFRWD